jgi:predicted DNA binding CopG/RHH family protein
MKNNIEDKEYLTSIEKDEWKRVKDLKAYKKHLVQTATNTLLKDQRMNIRIARQDLDGLKAKALEEGLPYQTLVASILHKYVKGRLKEKGA